MTALQREGVISKIMQFLDCKIRASVNQQAFEVSMKLHLSNISSTMGPNGEDVPQFQNFPRTWNEAKSGLLRHLFLFRPLRFSACPNGHYVYAGKLADAERCPTCCSPQSAATTFLYMPISFTIQVWFR
jgi:hypothetical protein